MYFKHHSIQDMVENKVVSLEFVTSNDQIVNILTKPLNVSKVESRRSSISLCVLHWLPLEPI